MFNYDWFHGLSFEQQQEQAKWSCVARRFPEVDAVGNGATEEAEEFFSELEVRTLVYLRDGFSYEVKQFTEVASKSHLVFECEPVDEHYKVGAFIVTVPFEEIVRVEVFAVHPTEKPSDMPQITGFRHYQEPGDKKYPDGGVVQPGH